MLKSSLALLSGCNREALPAMEDGYLVIDAAVGDQRSAVIDACRPYTNTTDAGGCGFYWESEHLLGWLDAGTFDCRGPCASGNCHKCPNLACVQGPGACGISLICYCPG